MQPQAIFVDPIIKDLHQNMIDIKNVLKKYGLAIDDASSIFIDATTLDLKLQDVIIDKRCSGNSNCNAADTADTVPNKAVENEIDRHCAATGDASIADDLKQKNEALLKEIDFLNSELKLERLASNKECSDCVDDLSHTKTRLDDCMSTRNGVEKTFVRIQEEKCNERLQSAKVLF